MTAATHLLDSSICISILKGESATARDRMSACEVGTLTTSIIVFAEVMLGAVARGGGQSALALFHLVPPLPFDQAAGERYATLPFKRGNFDRLIAAHALSLDLTIITANEKDFADVPGLRVENWTMRG